MLCLRGLELYSRWVYLCFLRERLIALTSDPLQMQIVDQIF